MAQDYKANLSEYLDAMKSVRIAKNLFLLLTILAVLVVLAGFVVLSFTDKLDACHRPATAMAPADAAVAAEAAAVWDKAFGLAMDLGKFLAPVAAALMVFTLFLGVMVALAGRLGGAGHLVGALFWALILVAVLVPWQRLSRSPYVNGALYSLPEAVTQAGKVVKGWTAGQVTAMDRILYYVRFLGYPVIAVLISLVVQVRFAAGYRKVLADALVTDSPQRSPVPLDARPQSPPSKP